MSLSQLEPVSLAELQQMVGPRLASVENELRRLIEEDLPLIAEVNEHLLAMRGKMFRPTLLLLADEATGRNCTRPETFAAVIELIHLATLVHDDAVDHSALRRGMPTINAAFSHQVSVIMGDFLYSRAVVELVRLGNLDALDILAAVTNEMTVGEMRQLLGSEPLSFTEEQYNLLIRAKTASLMAGACEVGALNAPPVQRAALARFGEKLGMAFQIVDDLLDYTSDALVTGKPSGLDLREHKVTPDRDVWFVATSCEEGLGDLRGMRALVQGGPLPASDRRAAAAGLTRPRRLHQAAVDQRLRRQGTGGAALAMLGKLYMQKHEWQKVIFNRQIWFFERC